MDVKRLRPERAYILPQARTFVRLVFTVPAEPESSWRSEGAQANVG